MQGPRFLAKALSQVYSPLDKDIVREAWVAGNLKEQLGVQHRYRKNGDFNTVESTALFEDQSHSSAPMHETEVTTYVPLEQTLSTPRTPPINRPTTHPPSQGLLNVQVDSVAPVSPAFSYYSTSALPVSPSTRSNVHPRSSTPPASSLHPLPPQAVVHESQPRPSLNSDGSEFEMHVRPTTAPLARTPRTPNESRPGLRERQESHMTLGLYLAEEEDDPPWSGAIAV